MDNKIEYKKSKPDTQDERINQLLARYSCVCQDVDNDKLKSKRKRTNDSIRNTLTTTLTSSTTENGQKSRHVCAYPISNGRYINKFRNSSNSSQNNGLHLLPGHDYNCSYISNVTNTDLTVPKTNEKCPSEDARSILKNNIQDGRKHHSQNIRKTVIDSYDRNFESKVMEKNAKLQKLLIKYVIGRQIQKAKENHRDTPSGLQTSDFYREILHDLYDTKDEEYPNYLAACEKKKDNFSLATTLCEKYSNKYVLPCRLETGKNENPKNVNCTYPCHETKMKSYDKNFLPREPSKSGQHFQPIQRNSINQVSNCNFKQNRAAQTHITFGNYLTNELHTTDVEIQDITKDMNEVENNGTTKENHHKIIETVYNPSVISDITSPLLRHLGLLTTDVEKRAMAKDMTEVENIATIEDNHDMVLQSDHNPAIRNVEKKLDMLIDLFNSLVSELKSKKMLCENKSNDVDEYKQETAIESLKAAISNRRMRIVCNVMTNTSLCALESNLTPSHYFLNMRLDKILREEAEKSNIVRNEIADMLNKTSRSSAEVNVEIPTKECSTEVTASLSKTKLDYRTGSTIVEDIPYRGIARSTLERRIAVNTEPLGLVTLLRLSSAAMKQILSFIPALSWYFPGAFRPVHNCDYVCNICGAAFARPSQLNAHILRHDFDQPRECRVCRRTVSQRSSQLFRCRHCGRVFARAYCCELHERECHIAHGWKKSLSRALLK